MTLQGLYKAFLFLFSQSAHEHRTCCSPIYSGLGAIGAAVEPWLPLQPAGTAAAKGISLREGDVHPLPCRESPSHHNGLLKSSAALLLAKTGAVLCPAAQPEAVHRIRQWRSPPILPPPWTMSSSPATQFCPLPSLSATLTSLTAHQHFWSSGCPSSRC